MMGPKLKVAVLISGRGSNLQALIDACQHADYPAQIAVVISNKAGAQGLERAQAAGIPAIVCDQTHFKGNKLGFEALVADTINDYEADLVCLAGFMRILSADFLAQFEDRVINIHPSLLPKYKGLDTHTRAIEAGEAQGGCSVHIVTPAMDEGAVIAQAGVDIMPDDTPDSLAARVLVQEHLLYPDVVKDIALGAVVLRHGRIERAESLRHHVKESSESLPKSTQYAQGAVYAHTHLEDGQAQAKRMRMLMRAAIAGGLIAFALIMLAATFI